MALNSISKGSMGLLLLVASQALVLSGCISKDKVSYTYPESIQDVRDDRIGKILGKDIVLYGNGPSTSKNDDSNGGDSLSNIIASVDNARPIPTDTGLVPSGGSTGKVAPKTKIALEGEGGSKGKKILVNSYLWQGAIETLAAMPLILADPASGFIATDWFDDYQLGLRYKVNVVIAGSSLRSDALRVNVFIANDKNSVKDGDKSAKNSTIANGITDIKDNGTVTQEELVDILEKQIMVKARDIKYYAQHNKN